MKIAIVPSSDLVKPPHNFNARSARGIRRKYTTSTCITDHLPTAKRSLLRLVSASAARLIKQGDGILITVTLDSPEGHEMFRLHAGEWEDA